ncbi:diguanylate phosphodiesterase [Enterovibrio calviensis]|uniref:diguanylate phosphodiesterase n=1 Tax=Enterovibrio calviensis TaxID=91359 RepID=UPI003734FCA6
MHQTLRHLIEQHVVTDDDALILAAFLQNDIRHVCQAIRDVRSGVVVYQHVTLRFGSRGEQSVYSFDLSDGMRFSLDLYSLYLALRQSRFQIDTFHPDLVSDVVVPVDANALIWSTGQHALTQMLQLDKAAFSFLIPSLQINVSDEAQPRLVSLLATLRARSAALWFDISIPCHHIELMKRHRPDRVKLAITLASKQDRSGLLPLIRFFRSHRLPWVAGRISSQSELNQFRLLGASHYFGYVSDIPTSLSFKGFDNPDTNQNVE